MTILDTDLTLSEPGRLSPEFLAAIARSKGRKPAENIAAIDTKEILSISENIRIANNLGTFIPGKGVHFGVWELPANGTQVSKKFNMFAAPYDFGADVKGIGTTHANYHYLLREIAGRGNLLGHRVETHFNRHEEIYGLLRSGIYEGEWFVPPIEILTGKYGPGEEILPIPRLASLRNTASNFRALSGGYWSSTNIFKGVESDYRYIAVCPEPIKIAEVIVNKKDYNPTCAMRLVRGELIP